mmetsp:Transcript_4970/g.10814  ORF Transcript_4970/g.10814 Transcript_4970/m.10814 type:complete len:222 (-) Transcript_4970:240-905(-)
MTWFRVLRSTAVATTHAALCLCVGLPISPAATILRTPALTNAVWLTRLPLASHATASSAASVSSSWRELLSMLTTDSMMPPSLAASMLGGWSRTNLARHVAAAVLVAERALFSTRAPSVVTAPAAAATSWFRTWCSATSAASRSAAAALTASDAPFRRMATRGAITPASAASFFILSVYAPDSVDMPRRDSSAARCSVVGSSPNLGVASESVKRLSTITQR